jgi:hypothetical protein
MPKGGKTLFELEFRDGHKLVWLDGKFVGEIENVEGGYQFFSQGEAQARVFLELRNLEKKGGSP